jgi:hypothetical protein
LSDPYAILKVLDKQKERNKMKVFAVYGFDGLEQLFQLESDAIADVAKRQADAKAHWFDTFGDFDGDFDQWYIKPLDII